MNPIDPTTVPDDDDECKRGIKIDTTDTIAGGSHRTPAILKMRQQRLKRAVRRDVLFLLAGAIALSIVTYVETNASDDEIRLNGIMRRASGTSENGDATCTEDDGGIYSPRNDSASGRKIVDAGFILTASIHSQLARHRDVNDVLAMGNSVLLTIPLAYAVYVTIWKGDFRLSFRLIGTHLFRSFCGWFTYLPPDPEFLSSFYDFPEILLCSFQDCSVQNAQVNFLTFFSGHIAATVIIANHLYMSKYTRMSVCLHCFNWLQAIRLLATRGHYSIDLIFGYVVAAFVSGPAERLGLYYSRGVQPTLPGIVKTLEILVGARGDEGSGGMTEAVARGSLRCDEATSCDDLHNVESETSIRIVLDIVADFAQIRKANETERDIQSMQALGRAKEGRIILDTVVKKGN